MSATYSQIRVNVQLRGIADLLFNRLPPGTSFEKGAPPTPTRDKLYLDDDGQTIIMPSANIIGFLANKDTRSPSAGRMVFARGFNKVAPMVGGFIAFDPVNIPVLRDGKPILFNGRFDNDNPAPAKKIGVETLQTCAKAPNSGVPNFPIRPLLLKPWTLEFELIYIDNDHVKLEHFKQMFDFGRVMGLGSYRTMYGRFDVSKWDVSGVGSKPQTRRSRRTPEAVTLED